jgi:quercetin dioxygenase-like cupin family protein
MSHRSRIFLAVLSVAVVSLAGAAFATNPSGLTSTTPVRGLLGPVDVKHDNIELETEGQTSADVAVATLTFAPGGSSGWHHHPGVVVVLVESGAITFYDQNCKSEVHHAGEAFVESSDEPGLAKNAGTVNAVVHATYIVPTSGSPAQPTPLRIDDPQPEDCSVT